MSLAGFGAGLGAGDFNPTLVQLEFARNPNVERLLRQFQSHIGAIRIFSCSDTDNVDFLDFNPTLVQLE